MNILRNRAVLAFSATLIASFGTVAAASSAEAAGLWWTKNCTALNQKFPHGVGKSSAVDSTSGRPVTTFLRSNKKFRTAMSHNRGLDRDGDKIACEKA